MLGIARDVTERKQKDEELQQYRDQLENMVQTRTADLEASNRQLQTEIAERQKVESELVHLERIQAMWEFSAGVSHNLNNILSGVLIPVQMLERTITDEKALKNIKMISASGRKAADLVSRLHQAIRADEKEPLKAVQVNEVVKDVIQATQPRWRDEPEARGIPISVETDLQAKCDIRGSESELFDCLINLVFNAVDAMPEGGTLHIATSGNENEVKLEVKDTGKGMDEATRLRVFEPFFTTKTDVGTGLGLFTVYGTITRWGGNIQVETEPGRGTSFILNLPA